MLSSYISRFARLLAGGILLGALPMSAMAAPQPLYATPDAAFAALQSALASGKPEAVVAIFGEANRDLVVTGDKAADTATYAEAVRRLEVYHLLDPVATDRRVVLVGAEAWPFPIPIVKEQAGWRFASEQGRVELLDRRIGSNELFAISVMRAYLDAQRQYALADRNGDRVREYAQRLGSTAGQHDGLYWAADESKGEEASPWGPLIASTSIKEGSYDETIGYRGYRYRVLTRQGAAADGGAFDYLINGRMLAGFGLVAYPSVYGTTGVTSFIINRDGRTYQRDLGTDTAAIAQAMTSFDPTSGWSDVDR